MMSLEYYEYNHSVLRVYRDDSGIIWYLKDDLVRLLDLEESDIQLKIPEENLLKISIFDNYLNSVPNLSDNPKTLSSVKLFIDNKGLNILLKFVKSKELKTLLVNWIKSEIIKDRSSKTFEVSDRGISESTINLSNREYLENWFYEELNSRLYDKFTCSDKDKIEKGIKLALDVIKDNDIELLTPSGIKLKELSGKNYEIYKFSKEIKSRIENFLKEIK